MLNTTVPYLLVCVPQQNDIAVLMHFIGNISDPDRKCDTTSIETFCWVFILCIASSHHSARSSASDRHQHKGWECPICYPYPKLFPPAVAAWNSAPTPDPETIYPYANFTKMDSEVQRDGRILDLIDDAWREDKLPYEDVAIPLNELPEPEQDNGGTTESVKEQEMKWTDLALQYLHENVPPTGN
ncbi:hypothetical protein KIL84_022789 [Mauremys mutica]|nr:hypothetical protein KIL84_022789 [Mauremys mutica]